MPDPVLKTAMEEIKVILKKHDIAAQVTLASTSHTEYLYEVSPSWSCVRLEDPTPDGSVAIRVRAKSAEFPSLEARNQTLAHSVGMLFGFHDQAERVVRQMAELLKMLAPYFQEFKHWEREEK